MTEELGRGARLRGSAASELVAAAYAAESAHGPRLARGLSLADIAHAVALVEEPTLHEPQAHRLEVARRDNLPIARCSLVRRWRVALDS